MAELYRLEIVVPESDFSAAMVCLTQRVSHGWEEREVTGGTLFRIHFEDRKHCEALARAVRDQFPDVGITLDSEPDKDWVLAWREFFTPVPAGDRFLVLAPWMKQERAETDRICIVIEPKTAFGTGHHPTTALCLEAVSDLYGAGILKSGMRFLDLGTGSGILGIGCAELGLRGVGVDLDPIAVANALENRVLNSVEKEMEVRTGSVDTVAEERFDLVLANILARPLMDMAPAIVAALAPGGTLVLSGLLTDQAEDVARVYIGQGLPEPRHMVRGEWTALVWA
jgi:ribosomal protein L11 methyltransferase